MKRTFPVDVLWCPNRGARARKNGWQFPPAVKKQILSDFADLSIVHFFGGMADFGTRLDIDINTRPDVVGDAWLPPFRPDSFDVVILDPPYFRLNQQEKNQLLMQAAMVARHSVVWFHTIWIAGDRGIKPYQAFLVRVGDTCQCRCLQYFRVYEPKRTQPRYVERGPAKKYNHWLAGEQQLNFG